MAAAAGRYVGGVRDVELEVCGRRYRTVAAESFRDALLGVHAVAPEVEAIVIRGASVHGFTLRKPIWVFGLNDVGVGARGLELRPRRVVRFAGASNVVELLRGLACESDHRSHTVRWYG